MSYDPYQQDDEPRQRRRGGGMDPFGRPEQEPDLDPFGRPRRRPASYDDEDADSTYEEKLRRRQRAEQQHSGAVEDVQGHGHQGSGGIGTGLLGLLLRNPKVLMAVVMALIAVVGYFNMPTETNPITDQTYKIPWKPDQDIALGLQARDQMMAQHGGEHPDVSLQREIDRIGMNLIKANAIGDWAPIFQQYKWDFHLLRDPNTINAFALPGGQIFFTYGLFSKLKTEDEIAGVLGHEIGHVIGRHSAKQMAKQKLVTGVAGAGSILMSGNGQNDPGRMAQVIGAMLTMKYGRDDETQSDTVGVQFMMNAGYNPEGLIRVMEVLKAAMGGQRQPEFMSTHPDPGNRIENIKATIAKVRAGELEGPKPLQERAEQYQP